MPPNSIIFTLDFAGLLGLGFRDVGILFLIELIKVPLDRFTGKIVVQ